MLAFMVLLSCATKAPPVQPATEAPRHRLDGASLDELGQPSMDGFCSENVLEEPLVLDGCLAVGPFRGDIYPAPLDSEEFETPADALVACGAEPTCMGVSALFSQGMPWHLALQGSRHQLNNSSYGCFFVLDCR